MKDSIIYSKSFSETDSFQNSIKNSDFSDYIPFTKFSNNKIQNFRKDSLKGTVIENIGTYEYFNSKKLLFIYTSIWYNNNYVPLHNALMNRTFIEMAKEDEDYYNSEKTCELCNKKFTKSIFVIESMGEDNCKIEIHRNNRYIEYKKVYCTRDCAEEAATNRGLFIKRD